MESVKMPVPTIEYEIARKIISEFLSKGLISAEELTEVDKAFQRNTDNLNERTDTTNLIMAEAKRLSDKYKKEYLDCKDLMQILGVGRDNVRALMRSSDFPTISIGNRKVVSVLSFVIWQRTA